MGRVLMERADTQQDLIICMVEIVEKVDKLDRKIKRLEKALGNYANSLSNNECE